MGAGSRRQGRRQGRGGGSDREDELGTEESEAWATQSPVWPGCALEQYYLDLEVVLSTAGVIPSVCCDGTSHCSIATVEVMLYTDGGGTGLGGVRGMSEEV